MRVKKFCSIIEKNDLNNENYVNYKLSNAELRPKDTEENDENERVHKDSKVCRTLEEFSYVFSEDLPSKLPLKSSVNHLIDTDLGAQQPQRPLFQLFPFKRIASKEYLTSLLEKKKLTPSTSSYKTPFVVKRKGKVKEVLVYLALTGITKQNHALLPRIDEMFYHLDQTIYFSKLGLKTGSHQIRISPEDIKKAAFNTRYRHFEFMVMIMALRNAPATFQSLTNSIFFDSPGNFMVLYLYDVVIYSMKRVKNMQHLRKLFSRLRDHKQFFGNRKFKFLREKTENLRLKSGKMLVGTGDERRKAIHDLPTPTTTSGLQGFLCLLQFFRRFIKV